MNEIKIPSIEFVRLKKGMTDSELNDYIAENDDYSFLVYLRYKYDFEEEVHKQNICGITSSNEYLYGIEFDDGARFCVDREQIEFVGENE